MESDKRARVEAWLRYGADLELGPYYRDRVSPNVVVETNQAVVAPSAEPPQPPIAAGARAAGASSSFGFSPTTPAAAAPARSSVAAPFEQAPSLFESSDRIAGDTFQLIRETIGDCTRCKLHKARTNIVFGVGSMKAELVFVGEGPGHDEDIKGEPFVGRAGKLLTQMIEAMGLRREDVYICNVVKCRPPENRLPEKDEITTCSPFLFRQIDVIRPKVICCLGSCASQTLLQTTQGISRFRGEWFDFRGSKLIATYHPAYLLRNPNAKGEVWKDLQKVMTVLGLQPKRK
ncbi:MAG: uracil-DNA glycosylase [Candidatus Acidiferrales bacterium]